MMTNGHLNIKRFCRLMVRPKESLLEAHSSRREFPAALKIDAIKEIRKLRIG